MIPTSLPLTRPNASASGRPGHGFSTRNSGGTVRSTVGQPQEHLPVTRAWSSWGRNAIASGGANPRRRHSAISLSFADKGLSSSNVLAGLSLRKRSSRLMIVSSLNCARSSEQRHSLSSERLVAKPETNHYFYCRFSGFSGSATRTDFRTTFGLAGAGSAGNAGLTCGLAAGGVATG
jgi:hypothetical protein